MEIVRGDNRDKSGINGDFLCIKGRYAFDFAHHEDRLTQPLIRKDGQLVPSTWEEAFDLIGRRFKEVREQHGGSAIGVFGSNRTTNEENYLLQKFARVVLQTNNIDHHRTADFPGFAAALQGYLDGNKKTTGVTPSPASFRFQTPTRVVSAIVLLIAVLGAIFGGLIVVTLRTKDGTLVVEVNEPGAKVSVHNERGEVEITRASTGGTLTLSADE
jgi:NADH dehydrogenase/NADH:ubiquinone oxidoreductase subunit G